MIGCDIVAIARIERICARYGKNFLDKILSQNEQNLATKEAASKALGVGICRECGFLDIQIQKDKKNAPKLKFSKKIKKKFKIKQSSLSIAHDGGFAMAVVAVN